MAKQRWDKSQDEYWYSYDNPQNTYYKKQNKYSVKTKWVIKSKNCNNKHIEKQNEINKSRGTILYCKPNATYKDIIKIKPNEVIPQKPEQNCIRIIACGCTHELHRSVYWPSGDILIHAGDVCNWRRYNHTEKIFKTAYDTWSDFTLFMNKLKNRSKDNFKYGMYLIPGNHDLYLEQNENKIKSLLNQNNIKLLRNESTKINLDNNNDKYLTMFGSPISFNRGKPSNAYQVHRHQFKDLWNKDDRSDKFKHFDDEFIEKYFYHSNNNEEKDNLDILITHGPALNYGDCEIKGKGSGSYQLLEYIKKEKPKLFICCDYHGSVNGNSTHGYGINFVNFDDKTNKSCIWMNVAIAHQPARFMRDNNIKRGVTIIDINLDQF